MRLTMAIKYKCPECGEESDDPGECNNCADDNFLIMGIYDAPELEEVDDDDEEDYDNNYKPVTPEEARKLLKHMETQQNVTDGCGVVIAIFVILVIIAIFWSCVG